MLDPITQYERNRDVYDEISDQIESTHERFAQAPRHEQKIMLNKAVTFALISAQTDVTIHERGYLRALDADSFTGIEEAFLDAGVNYYRNKAKYVMHNVEQADFDAILDLYDEGRIDAMHRAIADECKGVSTRKAGFAMALAVTSDKMCIDTHVAQRAGIDPDDIYNGVVVDRYEQQCDEVLANWPDLRATLSPFMCQWVVFDSNRKEVTTHDAWFMSRDVDRSLIEAL